MKDKLTKVKNRGGVREWIGCHPELESIAKRCWQHSKGWEVPPNWGLRDWQEELFAQARAAAWEAYVAYDPARGVPLEAFVFIRVREALRTYWRREWNEARHRATLPPPSPDDEEESENWEFTLLSLQQEGQAWQRALIRLALSQLRGKERFVIERLFWDGWTEAEIAQRLGISQQAISRIKRQSLKKLGEIITRLGEPPS